MKFKKECLIICLAYLVSISVGQDGWEIFEEENPSLRESDDRALRIEDLRNDDSDKDLDLLWEFMDADTNDEISSEHGEVNHMENLEDEDEMESSEEEEDESEENDSEENSSSGFFDWMKSKAKEIFGENRGPWSNQWSGRPRCPFMAWMEKKEMGDNTNFGPPWLHAVKNIFRQNDDRNASHFSNFAQNFLKNIRNNNSSDLGGNMKDMWRRFGDGNRSHMWRRFGHGNRSHISWDGNRSHVRGQRWLSHHGVRNSTAFIEHHSKLICMIVTGTKKMTFFHRLHEMAMENLEEKEKVIRVEFLNKTVTCCEEEDPSECLHGLKRERIDNFCDLDMPLRPWAFFPILEDLEDRLKSECCGDNRGENWIQCVMEEKRNYFEEKMQS